MSAWAKEGPDQGHLLLQETMTETNDLSPTQIKIKTPIHCKRRWSISTTPLESMDLA
jgi:hypothetical protein